jgi:hypothetical protein
MDRSATRPIWLDKGAIAQFVEGQLVPEIVRWLRRQKQDEPIGHVDGIVRGEPLRIESVKGYPLRYDVYVSAREAKGKYAAVLGGRTRPGVIELEINGALTPAEYLNTEGSLTAPLRIQPIHSCRAETCLNYGLYSLLIHEATHAAEMDHMKGLTYSPKEVMEKGEAAWGPYINDPSEVRAFMQQIADEVIHNVGKSDQMHVMLRERAEKDPHPNQKLLHYALLLSTTWKVIEDHLTPKNKATILKGVYDRMEQAKLLFDEQGGMDRLAASVALKYANYFKPGDIVLYGKYKNKRGKIVGFSTDKWGNPTIEVEPIPKGRKQNKVFGLYKVWRADVKENALKAQAEAEAAGKTAGGCKCTGGGAFDKKLHDFAHLFMSGMSDRQIMQEMGISYNEAHSMANTLRNNLGIGPDQSLRDALKNRHAAVQFNEEQFGRFKVRYIKQHAEHLEEVGKLLLESEQKYQAAGVPLQDNILVALYGGGIGSHAAAVYHMGSSPPAIQVAPKAYEDASFLHTLIHELAHYYHDKVVPGGQNNVEVMTRFMWAMRQKRTQAGGSRDVLKRRLDVLNKRYKELEETQYIHRPLPRKGTVVEYDTWSNGVQYHIKGKIVGKKGRDVLIEIIEAPEKYLLRSSMYRRGPGPLVVPESASTLTYVGKDEAKERELKEVEKERHEVYETLKGEISKPDDRYEVQLHDWVPTTYSRKNHMEWFAELLTTFVLGHLKEEPSKWLLSVIKTGKAPEGLPPADEEATA